MGELRGVIRAIVFDLDGVLVNTDLYHFRSWQQVAHQQGIPFTSELYDKRMRGVGRRHALDVLLQQAGRPYSVDERAVLTEAKNRWYLAALAADPPCPAAGAVQLLDQSRQRGLKVALASSSKNAGHVLKLVGLADRFDTIADGTIEPTKPDPLVFLTAAQRLGVAPSECVVLEDSRDGIQAARQARMKVFFVGPRGRCPDVPHGAEHLGLVVLDDLLCGA